MLIYGTCIGTLIFIYLAWKTNETVSVWTGLSSAGLISLLTLSNNFFNGGVQHYEEMMKHSNDLIQNVFQQKVVTHDIIYDEDVIKLIKPNQQFGELIISDEYDDKDVIHRLCVEWNETNPMLDFVTDHLKHKTYRRSWQAYANGKKHAKVQIDNIFAVVKSYREIVESQLDNAKLQLKVSENRDNPKAGEYSKKWINHSIFYDASKMIEDYFSDKDFGTSMAYYDQSSNEFIVCLKWGVYDENINEVEGESVAIGDEESIHRLKKILEQIRYDKEIRALVLEFNCLKRCLENNQELETFEAERKEIVNQVTNKKQVLAGKCNQCP